MSETMRPILTIPVTSVGAIVARRFVHAAGDQAVADENVLGVARAAASATGQQVPVDVLGTVTIEAGAAITKGATLKSDASGRAITWASAGAKVAIALEAAGAAGEFIEALLIPNVA